MAARVGAVIGSAERSERVSSAESEPEPWVPGDGMEGVADGGPRLASRRERAPIPAVGSLSVAVRNRANGWLARMHWRTDGRAVLALGAVVALVAAVTLWWVLSARPRALAVHSSARTGAPPVSAPAGLPSLSASSAPSAAAKRTRAVSATRSTRLVVDVAGKVHHPGVYRLPSGARVVDALRAAGGALPGVSTLPLNLAQPVRDGQQIVVGVNGRTGAGGAPATAGGPGAGTGTAPGGGTPIDLNSATLAQLQQLPGVGPVLAQHILDWRTQHGRFARVDQLNDVTGIGEVKFAQLRPLVTV